MFDFNQKIETFWARVRIRCFGKSVEETVEIPDSQMILVWNNQMMTAKLYGFVKVNETCSFSSRDAIEAIKWMHFRAACGFVCK